MLYTKISSSLAHKIESELKADHTTIHINSEQEVRKVQEEIEKQDDADRKKQDMNEL